MIQYRPALPTETIRAHLAERTYKPGWSFTVYDGTWEGQHVVITAVLPDAYRAGTTTTVDIHSMLPPMESVEQLDRWMLWRLARIEVHEVREFYRDTAMGTPVDDPHAPNAERDNPDYQPKTAVVRNSGGPITGWSLWSEPEGGVVLDDAQRPLLRAVPGDQPPVDVSTRETPPSPGSRQVPVGDEPPRDPFDAPTSFPEPRAPTRLVSQWHDDGCPAITCTGPCECRGVDV